jgi:hypothetical protein
VTYTTHTHTHTHTHTPTHMHTSSEVGSWESRFCVAITVEDNEKSGVALNDFYF